MSVGNIAQEEEDLSTKVFKLEDRVASLEQTLNSIVNDAKQVLTDVRAILSELENPMNYLKGLGIDEVMLRMAEQITEAKIKEFMDRKVSALIKTMLEGKVKDTVTVKIKELLDEELKKHLGEAVQDVKKLIELLNNDDFIKAISEKLLHVISPDKMKEEIMAELTKRIEAKISDLRTLIEEQKASQVSQEQELKPQEARRYQKPKIYDVKIHEAALAHFLGSYCLLSIMGKRRLDKMLSHFMDLDVINKSTLSIILKFTSNIEDGGAHNIFDDMECCIISNLILSLMNNEHNIPHLYALYLLIKKCRQLANALLKVKSKNQS